MEQSLKERLARYHIIRALQRDLNHTLSDLLPRNAVKECGARLGILKNDSLVFRAQSEVSVLADYCIYDYRWNGQNVIERYIKQTPLKDGSDQKSLLEAMRQARYSVFAIDEVEKGVGVLTHDLLRGDSGFVIDVALSETAPKGMVLACRVISPDNGRFSMGTGAPLPADRGILKKVREEIPKRFGKTVADIALLSPEKRADLSAAIIRIFLEGDAASYVSHEGPVMKEVPRASPHIGRNDPCPCGSGKKYKKCCGA